MGSASATQKLNSEISSLKLIVRVKKTGYEGAVLFVQKIKKFFDSLC